MTYLVQQLLGPSVRRSPDHCALVHDHEQLSYRELDELSDRLAHLLRRRGIERGDRVGLWLPKSLAAVVAIFAVLKAEAVYVPIDPNMPIKRVQLILADCGVRAIITTAAKLAKLDGPTDIVLAILTDAEPEPETETSLEIHGWAAIEREPLEPLPSPTQIEDDLAYILYTSGSTGVPKGVMISHRAALTFIDWAHATFAIDERDRVSSHAPFHFDLSIFDLFVSIKAGATVILVPAGLAIFPSSLGQFIADQRISVWYSVPSVLTSLVLRGELDQCDLSRLRAILFAGEVFPIKHLRALMAKLPHARTFNLYGPTETNVCTWYEVPPLDADQLAIPIGKACANMEVFMLAASGERVDDEGELCVGGPGLMRGYWGRPEQSRAVLHPFPRDRGRGDGLIYHTGDLVRRRDDGEYLYLGRRDNMIKSQGYRIELGEIEAALTSHPEVIEAIAIAVPDDELGNRIHAFVVARAGQAVTSKQLLGHCKRLVPQYMVPHALELCAEIPRTSTGKADRRRLAARD